MRVFVTGATGFIGFAIVEELLREGHTVTGLARTEESGRKLQRAGAQVAIGSVEDLECLRRAASNADGVIHTAFYHKISHMPLRTRMRVILGGAPSGIVGRFMGAAVHADRAAIEAMGSSLREGAPLVATFGTLAMKPGHLAMEDESYDPAFIGAPRAETESVLRRLASRGIRTSAIRLPPTVHGAGDHAFAPELIKIARRKKFSGFAGDGSNRWPSVHRLDAARLFRLALESGTAGGTYHGVAEQGIPFRDIAGFIASRLQVPAVSMPLQEAEKHFGFLGPFIAIDNPTSSRLTRERLGWMPTQPGLLQDMQESGYF